MTQSGNPQTDVHGRSVRSTLISACRGGVDGDPVEAPFLRIEVLITTATRAVQSPQISGIGPALHA